MTKAPAPPRTFIEFSRQFPKIAEAWGLLSEAGSKGELDEKVARLIKLGISIGNRAEGATHSATRKAIAAGATSAEILQVVALAASTIGLPQAVAAFSWIQESLPAAGRRRGRRRGAARR